MNATELPPTGTLEGHTQPAPYELDDQMDVTEDPIVQDPEASGVMLTDEQLAEELYGPQTGCNLLLEGEDVSASCTYFHIMLPLEHDIK